MSSCTSASIMFALYIVLVLMFFYVDILLCIVGAKTVEEHSILTACCSMESLMAKMRQ